VAGYTFPAEDHPDSPWPIFERVLRLEELSVQAALVGDHEVKFAFAMRFDGEEVSWFKGGRQILGMAHMPRVSGQLSDLFDQLLEDTLGYAPDFLIVLNGEWWEAANDIEREILVAHETGHCGQALDRFGEPRFNRQTEAPVLAMVPHDVEEFHFIARRYGAWKSDLREFMAAMEQGEHGRRDNGGPPLVDAPAPPPPPPPAAPEPLPVDDGDLPPDVGPVDPADVELSRDNPPQHESPRDLF
jgi:hypothetical protein